MADYVHEVRRLVGHKPMIMCTAAGVLVNNQNEVLLNERVDTHNWSLPGGFLEYGETFAQACVREYKEDSGLDVEIIDRIDIFDQGEIHYPNGDIVQSISGLFHVKQTGGELLASQTDETISVAYWPFDQLPPLLNQQTKDMLAAAQTFLAQK
ncbi:NUDIX hydrolase [Paucilactobacillus sp. N302-9]